jgi:hypothetical protein
MFKSSTTQFRELLWKGSPWLSYSRPTKWRWLGEDPYRGRFIGLPGVMCEFCSCPCCKWERGRGIHSINEYIFRWYVLLSVNEQPVADKAPHDAVAVLPPSLSDSFFLLLLISAGYCSLMPNGNPFNLYAFYSTICRSLWYIKWATTARALFIPRSPKRWTFPNSMKWSISSSCLIKPHNNMSMF